MKLQSEISKDQQSSHSLGWKEAPHAACWSPACTQMSYECRGLFQQGQRSLLISADKGRSMLRAVTFLPRRFWVQKCPHGWQNASLVAPQFLEGHGCVLYMVLCAGHVQDTSKFRTCGDAVPTPVKGCVYWASSGSWSARQPRRWSWIKVKT